MKHLSLVLNVVLLIAVGILYYLHFSSRPAAVTAKSTIVNSSASVNNSVPIAYVDLDSLNANISVIKEKRKELEGRQRAIENDWENGMRGLENKKNEFIRKGGNTITQEQAQQFQGMLIEEQQKIEQRKQAATQDLTEKSYKFLEDIQGKLKGFLSEYNKDKNYMYIFTVGTGQDYMAYKDSGSNITADVIKGMNKKLGEK